MIANLIDAESNSNKKISTGVMTQTERSLRLKRFKLTACLEEYESSFKIYRLKLTATDDGKDGDEIILFSCGITYDKGNRYPRICNTVCNKSRKWQDDLREFYKKYVRRTLAQKRADKERAFVRDVRSLAQRIIGLKKLRAMIRQGKK
ncbi:MAG: hypothetical protein Q8Q37_01280 [bacterium]|nr:hypothetical protein [bacterium]